MKTQSAWSFFAVLVGISLLAGSVAPAGDSFFAEHALFKPLIGEWEASGELKGQDGNTLKVTETWTGSIGESGNFLIKGTRHFNDEMHTFEWEYLYNPTTELIEGVMRMSTSEDEIRLEVNLSEQDKTITLKSQLSGDGSALEIVNKVAAKKITGVVKLTNAEGVATLSGEVVHEKKKEGS